jgi:hypothetical protein
MTLLDTLIEKSDTQRLLILVSEDDDAAALSKAAHEHSLSTLTCHGLAELCMEISEGANTAIIEEEFLIEDTRDELLHVLKAERHAPKFGMISLLAHHRSTAMERCRQLEQAAHVIVLPKQLDAMEVIANLIATRQVRDDK